MASNRLHVGLTLLGPLAYFREKMNLRPHTKLFMQYISHLDIDLTLFFPMKELEAKRLLEPAKDYMYASRMFYEVDRLFNIDYCMDHIIKETGGSRSRILCISSEVTRDVYAGQAIVVEKTEAPFKTESFTDSRHFIETEDFSILKSVLPAHKREKVKRRDDFVLLGLAEMIHELTQMEEMDVADYIATAPLLEHCHAPMFNHVHYLPMVNCLEYKDQLAKFQAFAEKGPAHRQQKSADSSGSSDESVATQSAAAAGGAEKAAGSPFETNNNNNNNNNNDDNGGLPFEVEKWKPLPDLSEEEIEAIRQLNNVHVPACNNLTMDQLKSILGESILVQVAYDEVDGAEKIIGFIIAYVSGMSYPSPNYQYFQKRFGDHGFIYVDRIIVDAEYHGRGIGRQLYHRVVKLTKDKVSEARAKLPQRPTGEIALCCEVNVFPRNSQSLAFHAKLGFKELGQQDTDTTEGKKRVSLLARDLPRL